MGIDRRQLAPRRPVAGMPFGIHKPPVSAGIAKRHWRAARGGNHLSRLPQAGRVYEDESQLRIEGDACPVGASNGTGKSKARFEPEGRERAKIFVFGELRGAVFVNRR